MPKLKRALSINDLYEKNYDILPFTGAWLDHIGQPERKGSWCLYGHSGNGKTSYATQMARYLATFGKVWYNGLEEGSALSFKKALQRVGMEAVKKNFNLIEDPFEDLTVRLKRRNRPDFCFIDSSQLFLRSFDDYLRLEHDFAGKTQFIYISHAEGKKPEGRIAKRVEYLSFVKVWIEGYKAFPKSRYGGTEPFIIYPKRAAEYWSDIK